MKIRHLALALTLFIGFITKAQKTYVPDNAFEQVIIDLGYDNILDDSVLTANIDTVTTLHFDFVDIESLVGLEDFLALKRLTFWGTKVAELDLSNHMNLEYFSVYDDSLELVDLSNNPALVYLACKGQKLRELTVDNCTNLQEIMCKESSVKYLNLSTCPSLTSISCEENDLVYLNVANGSNTSISYFRAHANPDLTCIQVDDVTYSDTTWLNFTYSFDSTSVFSIDCGEPLSIVEDEQFVITDLYPNPTLDVLHIQLKKEASYRLYSILGKQVLHTGVLQTGNNKLNLAHLNSGIYALVVSTPDGNTVTKKIIKQ